MLLLQNPGDYFMHERVSREASPRALALAGLAELSERNPRDLSGGERQRLALAIVTDGEEPPAVLALDEPTRGMDRLAKAQLAEELRRRAAHGQAVIVATHDPEFACACAERAVLLADGRVIADGPAAELLAGGWYFATETARILGGAGGVLAPEQGAELLAARAARAPPPGSWPPLRPSSAAAGLRGGRAMSWPLASFTLVGLVLAVGWLAYERARPSARMVAVVATLAAVAALGRDAFVALPDVKPITAVTLVVGYALGPLPGFSVGAVGMLASNVMLGQGSYTPWQMAAWGLVGLLGAALGRLSGRRLGRVPLAFACAFTALLAKEIMNVYTFTLGATHTPAAFLLIAGSALPFDLTDVVASFLFGLAFAPELARVLARVRSRMDVRWEPAAPSPPSRRPAAPRPAGRCALAVLALVLAGATGAARRVGRAPASRLSLAARASVAREIAYLATTQNADGGWGAAAGQPSSELYSAWAAIGLAAAGRNPQSVRRDGHTVLDALRAQAGTLEDAGDYERTMLALRACGAPVTLARGQKPAGGAAALPRERRLLLPPGQPHGVRGLRAARRRALRERSRGACRGRVDRAPAGRRRRLQLRRAGGRQRRRRHRRGAAGAGGRRHSQRRRRRTRGRVPAARAEPRRRLPGAARGRIQRAVHCVGRAGPHRDGAQRRRDPPLRQPLAARLPAEPRRPQRQRALFAHQRPSAGVGHRRGADRAGARAPFPIG